MVWIGGLGALTVGLMEGKSKIRPRNIPTNSNPQLKEGDVGCQKRMQRHGLPHEARCLLSSCFEQLECDMEGPP